MSAENSSSNSYFEFLENEEYFQRNLMDLSRSLSKSETAQLEMERKARAWEFSRYAEGHVFYIFIVQFVSRYVFLDFSFFNFT